MSTQLDFTVEAQVGYISFYEENEKHPCTLDHRTLDELNRIIDRIKGRQSEIRAVVVQSRSPKYFVVGANIKALQELSPLNMDEWVKKGHLIFNRFQQLPMPVIAKIQGYALGGGLELALACDFIVAAATAHFGQPEASLGVIPGWGGSYRLTARIGAARSKELFFTGKIITADHAFELGLVNQVVPLEELDQTLGAILEAIKKNDATAIMYTKQIINNHAERGMEENRIEEATASVVCLYSPGTRQRLEEFFNSRKK
jgi:enoyl-CoA hydratase